MTNNIKLIFSKFPYFTLSFQSFHCFSLLIFPKFRTIFFFLQISTNLSPVHLFSIFAFLFFSFKLESNDKTLTTFSPAADTPGPGHNFQSPSRATRHFGGPGWRPQAVVLGLRFAEARRDLENWAMGWGCRLTRKKAKISSFGHFSEKKLSSPPGTPTGSGFRQSCSKIFR